jgi:hypothetical protein
VQIARWPALILIDTLDHRSPYDRDGDARV